MAENFYTMLTIVGKNKLSSSAVSGSKVNFKTLKVGDGKGAYYEPSENQTSLVNEVWEGNISSISIDENNSNWIVVETVIPASDGGFFIREAGIFDEDGDMIAISKLAETYKPVVAEGSTKDLVIRIVLEVLNVDTVTIKIDPNVVAATKNDVQVLEAKFEGVSAQLSENTQNIAQLSNPNLLINGDFQVWQRGTSFNPPDAHFNYTADRWSLATMNNSFTVSKTPGSKLSITNSTSFTANARFGQIVEIPQSLYGKNLTFSICINCSINQQLVLFGASYDGSTLTNIQGSTIQVSSTQQIYNITFTAPSTPYVYVGLVLACSATGYFGSTGAMTLSACTLNVYWSKLELGSIATPFVPRLYAEELALCQRYYEKIQSVNNGTFCVGFNVATTQFQGILNYLRKRTIPTISFDTATNFRVRFTGGATAVSSFAIGDILYDRCGIVVNISGSLVAGQGSCLERSDGCTPYIAVDSEIY